jgi:hypothetical protein
VSALRRGHGHPQPLAASRTRATKEDTGEVAPYRISRIGCVIYFFCANRPFISLTSALSAELDLGLVSVVSVL